MVLHEFSKHKVLGSIPSNNMTKNRCFYIIITLKEYFCYVEGHLKLLHSSIPPDPVACVVSPQAYSRD